MSDTITITGNVATDPELRRSTGGLPITRFRIASSQRRYDRTTERWVEAGTNWYSVATYRSLAENAFQSLRKGDRVILTGRLKVRDWDNGTKSGTDVDIDAEAIGHDLLWGVSRFEKISGAVRTPPRDDAWAPAEGDGSAASAEQAADAAPSAAAEDQVVAPPAWSVPGEDVADAPVPDDAKLAEIVGIETPF